MFLPRRRQRRLLLPPGWLALGFILLLGCQVIMRAQMLQQRHERVVRLVIPKLKQDTAIINLTHTPAYKPLIELNRLRKWQNIDFTGEPMHDFFELAEANNSFTKLIFINSPTGGIRLCFHPGTSYATLIRVLTVYQADQPMYWGGSIYDEDKALLHANWNWLDVQHEPLTFYAVTERVILARKELK
jgi:hypothetical protein